MNIEIRNVNMNDNILENILIHMIDARLLCDYFMDRNNRSERGSCMYYASVLHSMLSENMPQFDWCLDGGWEIPSDDNGFVDEDNLPGGMIGDYSDEYESHFWVKCSDLNIICDTSSSQFGTGEIYITKADNPIYNANLDEMMIYEEIRYDSGLKPYNDNYINDIADPRKRFDAVLSKIFSLKNNREFQVWRENAIKNYQDDFNQYIKINKKIPSDYNTIKPF